MASKLCLVIPCYNEAARLSNQYFSELQSSLRCDLLFVDDGSTDTTLEWISTHFPKSKVLYLSSNIGKTKAVGRGLATASLDYEFVAVCDADGAISTQDWVTAFALIQGNTDFDIVSGARVLLAGMPVNRKLLRKWVGRIVATLVALILNTQIYDPQSPCKIYRTRFFTSINLLAFKTKWFLDAEMLLLKRGDQVAIREFNLSNWTDVPGSHLRITSFFEVLKDIVRILILKFFVLKWKKP